MKKIITIICLAVFSLGASNAQTTLTTAVDFTVTDLHGNSINLFTLLNQGKYVVIDFFFTTCGPCQQSAPHIKKAYQNYGCNTNNVVFLSIDRGDSQALCVAYENTYVGAGGPPMVSGVEGKGTAVCSAYKVGAYPTLILIAPDKKIVQKDMWPISTATDFDKYLSPSGLVYHACSTTGMDEIASPFHFELFPNPVSDMLNISSVNGSKIYSYTISDFSGRTVLSTERKESGNEKISISTSALTSGIYIAKIHTSEGLLVKKFSKY